MTVRTDTVPTSLPPGRERKRPASFKIEPSVWAEFLENAAYDGMHGSEVLRDLIEAYNRRHRTRRRATIGQP